MWACDRASVNGAEFQTETPPRPGNAGSQSIPMAAMKKALSEDSASLTSLDPSPVTVGASPASEGIAFNWSPYLYGLHSRNTGSPESDGRTERQFKVASFSVFDKPAAAGLAARMSFPSVTSWR
jgi:hypothetical protein